MRPSVGSADAIALIGAPGLVADEMAAPGSALVVLARSPGEIAISIRPIAGSSNQDANFSLELLAPGVTENVLSNTPAPVKAASSQQAKAAEGGPSPLVLDLVAHVSRRGDVKPDAEGWIAGPRAPSAIEGLEIGCRESDVAVAAQYVNAANPQQWSAWVTPGAFVGTRQKAAPLTALRLKLVGSAPERYELDGEALFLGSPRLKQRGAEIEFMAAGGSDPLVGLRLSLVKVSEPLQQPATQRQSRVRVFR